MLFRKDINGLRAIAVIAVVLFHFNASWLSGGFAGVDVFFVISGFLMTGIIFRGFEQNNFSILNFYIARANRIIPALAVLCFVLLVFGWFYLRPDDYKALGKHVGSSISFFSNIIYWREVGYFDTTSHEKWLLHTWSLSAEWQFYILYPLALVAMRKFMSLKFMRLTILIGTIVGFIFSAIATIKWPNPAYYLLPTRAWEMMLGGVAYLYPFTIQYKNKKLLEWVGLILIVGSFILISKENLWPGYLALFPVLGTFFVIQAQTKNSFILNSVFFQKTGIWSYSIYLWHWPLVVAINYFSLNNNYVYLAMLLSILLGFISYKYVEKIKFKINFNSFIEYLKCKPIYLILIIGFGGGFVFITNGIESHYSQAVIRASSESSNKNPYNCMNENNNFSPCYIGNKNNIKAIIVGDSHADALTTSLSNIFDLNSKGIVALTFNTCPLVINMKSVENNGICYNENIKRMEYLNKNHINIPVFWVARTAVYIYGQSNPKRINDVNDTKPLIYFDEKYNSPKENLLLELKAELNNTISKLKVNHPVYMVYPTPEMRKNIPKRLSLNILLNRLSSDLSLDYTLYLKRNRSIRKLISEVSISNGVEVLDPIPYLCKNHRCMAQYNNRPIYYDGDHLSEFGNKLLSPMFSSVMVNY